MLPYWIKVFIYFTKLLPTLNFRRVVYSCKYAERSTLVFRSEHTAPPLLMRVSCWSSRFQFARCRGGSSFINTVCPITVIFIFSLVLKYMLNMSLFWGVGKHIWMAGVLCVSLVTLTRCILERNIAAGCNWSWFAECQLLSGWVTVSPVKAFVRELH